MLWLVLFQHTMLPRIKEHRVSWAVPPASHKGFGHHQQAHIWMTEANLEVPDVAHILPLVSLGSAGGYVNALARCPSLRKGGKEEW